ncbi:MAG TPA: prepilin-type N-terminal cleavage/methylation domain-containing protein, partial [Kiritimatiellia bacterium]|nr:prepilin-type N-terminal cleavage/methylation domain-containing protein [Kiritimatiellia bacterium]
MPPTSPAPTSNPFSPDSAGFTLIEVLVALLVLGLTLTVVSQSVTLLLNTERQLIQHRQAYLLAETLHTTYLLDPTTDLPSRLPEPWTLEPSLHTDPTPPTPPPPPPKPNPPPPP